MTNRRRHTGTLLAIGLLGLCLVAGAASAASIDSQDMSEDGRESIDVAIALDTSGTMRNLIDSTRFKLWEIVNDLAEAEPTPRLRVAVLTFGNQKSPRSSGRVMVETDFTEDLDLVYERLSEIKTKGVEEYVGRVLKTAIEELSWSQSESALKMLFVAGNESADQDPLVSFREMSESAFEEGILVNALYCGADHHPDAANWREMAELAGGEFSAIDHRAKAVVIGTPFDAELAELGTAMNDTYIPIGKEGEKGLKSRVRQDDHAVELGPAVAASRAETKAGSLYASEWDLVSAIEAGRVDMYELDAAELPRAMRQMSIDERVLYIQDMQLMREEIRQRIEELSRQRADHVGEQMAATGFDDSRAFDSVLRRTIRDRAEEKGFYFPER